MSEYDYLIEAAKPEDDDYADLSTEDILDDVAHIIEEATKASEELAQLGDDPWEAIEALPLEDASEELSEPSEVEEAEPSAPVAASANAVGQTHHKFQQVFRERHRSRKYHGRINRH